MDDAERVIYRLMTFDDYYYANGGKIRPSAMGWLTSTNAMSNRALKAAKQELHDGSDEWLEKRTIAWQEYKQLVADGVIARMGSVERLIDTASRPLPVYECRATETILAARRILAKRRERGQPELQGVIFDWERETHQLSLL